MATPGKNGNGKPTLADLRFTPTEQRILYMLGDGLNHHMSELMSCLYDELASTDNLTPHISSIRKKLNSVGEDVVCVSTGGRRMAYRRIRPLHSNVDK